MVQLSHEISLKVQSNSLIVFSLDFRIMLNPLVFLHLEMSLSLQWLLGNGWSLIRKPEKFMEYFKMAVMQFRLQNFHPMENCWLLVLVMVLFTYTKYQKTPKNSQEWEDVWCVYYNNCKYFHTFIIYSFDIGTFVSSDQYRLVKRWQLHPVQFKRIWATVLYVFKISTRNYGALINFPVFL